MHPIRPLTAAVIAALVASLPVAHAAPPGPRRVLLASGFKPSSPQSAAFLARTSGLSNADKQRYDTLITGLVAKGLYSTTCDLIYAPGLAPDPTTANLNLISASFPLVPTGSPIYTPYRGYASIGAGSYEATGFNPTTAPSPHWSLNSAGLYAVGLGPRNPNAGMIGPPSGGGSYLEPQFSDGNYYFNLNGLDISAANAGGAVGSWLATRTDVTTVRLDKNGGAFVSTSSHSGVVANNTFALNIAGGDTYQNPLAFAAVCSGLTAQQSADLYSLSQAALVSSGAILPAGTTNMLDNFTGTVGPISGRVPDTTSNGNAWVGTGAGVAAQQAGGGKYNLTASGNNAYAVMQLSCTPREVGGTFQGTTTTPTPTIAVPRDYAGEGFNQMWHANLNTSTGSFSPGYWNVPGIVNHPPQFQSSSGTYSLSANTQYVYRVVFDSPWVYYSLSTTGGTIVATASSYDPVTASVIGPWVFFELGTTDTEWDQAYAKC